MRVVTFPDTTETAPHMELNDVLKSGYFIRDVTGVPLNSDRGETVPVDIDFAYQACPYSDSPSRYPDGQPHEMPMSGLERDRLFESYARVRKLTLAVRDAYMNEKPEDYELTVLDGLNIFAALQYLPKYLVNRAENPVPADQLPQHIVVGANCASGSIGAIGAFARGNIIQLLPPAEVMMAAAEEEGSLVGSKTVCAAPPRMIRDYLETLRSGKSITRKNIGAESDGLLKDGELRHALIFGQNIDMIMPTITRLQEVDSAIAGFISAYDPESDDPSILEKFTEVWSGNIRFTIDLLQQISSNVNLALGRQPFEKDDFSSVIKENQFGLVSIELAKQKGFELVYS